jgi:hypothetical protein
MKRITHFAIPLFLLIGYFANSQTILWTGNASNNDFFDEGNWKNSVTDSPPSSGTIEPGLAINLPLELNNGTTPITTNGTILLGTGSLTIGLARLTAESLSGGNVTINEGGYIDLTSPTPFQNNVQINFTSGIGWIKTLNYTAKNVSDTNLTQIKVNGNASVYKTNLRLDNYYLKGCVIRSNVASTAPLTIYDGVNLQGSSALISVNTIFKGDVLPNSLNNKIESFILKKGFMVTIAIENDGTGKSKNYIASEEDLIITNLPKILLNSVSFIRVMPWNWVTKKGRTDVGTDLNTTWRYKWNNTESSSLDTEFAPMAWGGAGANDDADIALYIGKYNSTHVMAFNEADNCNDQSGQYGNPKLCVVDEAVRLYKNLMKTGMRLVSPSCTEGAGITWLKDFRNKATAQDIRIDVIGVHWYDWGGSSNPSTTPNADATLVFNRFKAYLTNVHNLYGLPIWITEFNANPYRSTATNLAFMKLALPYLETLDYVERYNWFQPNPTPLDPNDNTNTVGSGEFYTTRPPGSAILTDVGIAYRDQVSTPSIPEATVNANNNLNLVDYPNIALNKTATASSTYFSFVPSEAVDGDSVTAASQWIVNFGVSGDSFYSSLPAWLEVDLNGSFTIDSFRIIEATKALKNFRFEVWDTTLNSGAGGWNSVVTVTGNPATPLTTYKTFNAVTTTKVRLYITGHNSLDYLKLFELEVYGVAATGLGNQNFEKQNFVIFPNPVSEGVLNITGDQEVQSVDVYTILGAKINTSFKNGQLLVTNLSPGIYFLKINNKYSYKFIKK